MAADDRLPTWPEITDHALLHLHTARTEMAEVRDWLRAVDSPLTDAQASACAEVLKITGEVKAAIDCAKGLLHDA